jgi:hypothetical protein
MSLQEGENGNPKSEIRKPKEIRRPKTEGNPKAERWN